MLRGFIISAIALSLAACAGGAARPSGFQASLPVAVPHTAASATDGAIFRTEAGYAPLYYGNRASRVGDLVTIVLVERTETDKFASGQTQRDGGFGLSLPRFAGIDDPDLNVSANGSFNGSGDASQGSSLRGDLTVTIAEVRPNGTALVRGEKLMRFSQGDEWIQLSGIIRLADIDQNNRVASIRVGDASIAYSGAGAVQESSRAGWLSRFFNRVSPF